MEYNYKLTSPNIIRISKSGNVGIGTTTPNASLYIHSPIDDGEIRIKPKNFEIRNMLSNFNTWIECNLEFKKEIDENGNEIIITSADFELSVFLLKRRQNERKVLTEKLFKWEKMRITCSGNVGLGSTTPNTTLYNNLIKIA